MRASSALRVAILAAFVALTLPPGVSRAQDDAGKREAREQLSAGDRQLARGDRLMGRGRIDRALGAYEKGLEHYRAAYDAYPDGKIYFPIALAEQKLGRFVDSLNHYRQLLEEGEDLNPQIIEQVEAQIVEVKKNLAGLDLVVEPEGATILVDGVAIGEAPLAEPHFMEPGAHTYAVTHEGFTPVEGEVDLAPGVVERREVELAQVPVVVEKKRPRRPPEDPIARDEGSARTPLWVGLGATALFATAATITGVAAVSKHGTYTDDSLGAEEREAARDSGKTLSVTTDLLWVATAASGAFTAWYYFRDDGDESRTSGVAWAPYVDGEGGGLAISGRF